ncbi:hypothetical protein [Amycolatopsis sp. NPDC004169]|uniref:hypothetical protein n=1 Tax=Amycolatopsis sp. NPDC004169 TaxID=3154453 RepID=UPI00339DD9CB
MAESKARPPGEIERIVAETLWDGVDDYVSLDSLIWNTREVVPLSDDRFVEVFRAVLDFLLRDGLMVVGDLGKTGFEPWTSTIEDTVERVVHDCRAVDWLPQLSLYWLNSTPKGEKQAKEPSSSS